MADFEKTVAIKFTTDANELLKALERITKLTAETKKQMEDLSKSSTASFSNISKAMVRAEEARVKKEISAVGTIEPTTGKKSYTETDKARIEELKRGLAEYKTAALTAQREIEAAQRQHNKNMLDGQKQYTSAITTLKKEELAILVENERKKRETERQGLTGTDLVTKAKEQADAAVSSYQKINEAYKQQVEERKTLSAQLIQSQDDLTRNELEEAKKRENALKVEANALKQNAINAQREYKQIAGASKQATETSGALSSLGNVARYVFGGILGVTAVTALRNMINYLNEAGQQALNYSKMLFTLSLAVRNLQRQGQPTSIGQLKEEIAAFRGEYNFFSELEVSKAFAEATNKLSNLGYTTEQVANVVKAGMIVYITDLTGRFNDLGEAINGVTNYLASGYGESLERSGFIAGRAGDKLLAFEKGLGQSLASLDPLTLSQERYNLLMTQTAEKAKDAAGFQDTLAGKYKAAQASITDANLEIGKSVDSLIVKYTELKAAYLSWIASTVTGANAEKDINAETEKLADAYVDITEKLNVATAQREYYLKQGAKGTTQYDKQISLLEAERDGLIAIGAEEEQLAWYDKQLIDLKEKKYNQSDLAYYDNTIEKLTETKKAMEEFLLSMTGPEITLGQLDETQMEEFRQKAKEDVSEIMDIISESGADEAFVSKMMSYNRDIYDALMSNDKEVVVKAIEDFRNEVSALIAEGIKVDPNFDTKSTAITAAMQKLYDGLYKIQDNYNERSAELWNDYVRDVGGKLRDLDNQVINIEIKVDDSALGAEHQKRMDEIEATYQEAATAAGQAQRDFEDKIAEAQRNYATQLAQSIRQYNIRRAELERKYRLNELQAERKFQEEMRKLREGFLMDLEGALRERDALQVIRLTREYNLQKEQRTRQFEEEKQTRKENYEEEKKQLAIEQQERQRQLAEELANRLASIKAEREAEKAQAEADKAKAQAEEQARYEQALADRARQYQQAQQELQLQTEEATRDFATQLKADGTITDEFLAEFGKKLKDYFGEGGTYDAIMSYFQTTVSNTGKKLESLSTEIFKTLGLIFGATGKKPNTRDTLFDIKNADKTEPSTNVPLSETMPLSVTVAIDEAQVQESTTTALVEANKVAQSTIDSSNETAKELTTSQPVELPIEITVDEIQVQESATAALVQANEIIQTTLDTSTDMGVEPISLPVVVSNETVLDEIQLALEEANTMRIEGLADIKEQNDAEQTELEAQFLERIRSFRSMLEEEGTLTQDALKQLIAVLNTYFGAGRPFDFIMTWFENRTALAGAKVIAIFTAIMTALKALMTLGKTGQQIAAQMPKTGGSSTSSSRVMYSGGAEVYTKPTTIQISEYEPEFVEITPLSKLSKKKAQSIIDNPDSSKTAQILAMSKMSATSGGSGGGGGTQNKAGSVYSPLSSVTNSVNNNTTTIYNSNGGKGGGKSSVYISVGLDKGLYAELTDTVLDEAAEVFLDVMRNNS